MLLMSCFRGLRQGCSLRSFLSPASGGVPRAVKRAGRAGAPSTPGRLGYLAAERLMDLGRVYFFQFSGVVLRGLFLFYRSPVICEKMRAYKPESAH